MVPWNELTRRHFLKASGIGLSTLALGCPSSTTQPNESNAAASSTDAGTAITSHLDGGRAQTPPSTNDAGGDEIVDCEQTGNDIEGPFYRPDVPIRNELDLYGDAGMALTLTGLVLDLDCNPILNAVVDIWHADPTDVAAEDLVNSDSVDYDNSSNEMRYRGQTATDENGRYSFHTKKPGWYLNGDTFRPMHIHVKVWVGNTEKLTTQLYFQGDPYIEGDPWASPDREVVLSPDGAGAEKGTFNFTIA